MYSFNKMTEGIFRYSDGDVYEGKFDMNNSLIDGKNTSHLIFDFSNMCDFVLKGHTRT